MPGDISAIPQEQKCASVLDTLFFIAVAMAVDAYGGDGTRWNLLPYWEIMALSSFFLVIFEAEERTILKTGISYLIQMHVGMFFILVGFLIVEKETGR